MAEDIYMKILEILKEHYDKDPPYFVPSSELRSRLGMSVDELRPYAENLEMNGYVYKEEGFAPTFLLKIRHKCIDALKAGEVDILKECKLHGPEKLKILEILKNEYKEGNPYYVPETKLLRDLGLKEDEAHLLADELEYCGLAKKVEGVYPNFTLHITEEGLKYLEANKK
jgi:hypothetical protein